MIGKPGLYLMELFFYFITVNDIKLFYISKLALISVNLKIYGHRVLMNKLNVFSKCKWG